MSSSQSGSGPMGWAMVEHTQISSGNSKPFMRCGGAVIGTNQIAELVAVLVALRTYSSRSSHKVRHLIVETDSMYALKSATEWIPSWKSKGWRNSKNQPVSNLDLMQALDSELSTRKADGGTCDFFWVKGHSGNKYNELADELANQQAQEFKSNYHYNSDQYPGDDHFTTVPIEARKIIQQRFYPHLGQLQLGDL